MRQKECKEYLRYKFTEPEIKDFAVKLARHNHELAQLALRKQEVVSALAAQAKEKQAEIGRLSTFINEGYEHRDVECTIYYNDPMDGKKTIYRNDTQESVRTLKMDEFDLQEELPLDNPNEPPR